MDSQDGTYLYKLAEFIKISLYQKAVIKWKKSKIKVISSTTLQANLARYILCII